MSVSLYGRGVWKGGMEKGMRRLKQKMAQGEMENLGILVPYLKKKGKKNLQAKQGRHRLLLLSLLLNLMTLFSLFVFYWMPKLYSGHFGGGQLPLSLLK